MRRPATRAASRPSVSPSPSTTCQLLSTSPAFMLYVFIRFIVKQTVLIANLHQAEPPGRGRATGRPRPGLPQPRLQLLPRELPPPHFPPGRPGGARPCGGGALRETPEAVLSREGLRRDPHRLHVQRLRDLPDEPPEQRGPLPPVVDGVAVPAGGRPSPGVEVRPDLSHRPHCYLRRQVVVEGPQEHVRRVAAAGGEPGPPPPRAGARPGA